jgi:hypothetical protein
MGRQADREKDWASCMSEAAAGRDMRSGGRTWLEGGGAPPRIAKLWGNSVHV